MRRIGNYSLIALFYFLTVVGPAASDDTSGSYSKIAADVRPSVVTILVYDYNGSLKQIGSGFFYNEKGDIVTNSHVLAANTRAEIKIFSGEKYPVGAIIERNETRDFVKAQTHIPRESPFLKIAGRHPMVGDNIMVAGSPMGLEQTITEGIVSALRNLPGKGNVLQISAPVSPGSSGGPVLNMAGEVVGVASFQMVQGQNLNFAVPVESVFNEQKSNPRKLKINKDKNGVLIIE
jgi:S1-C subfamily serine protease